jgi:DNA adenine methylase
MIARPFLKWAGGKTALLPEILPRLPKKINTYYEPFVGGGAVFFALAAEKRFEGANISDVNSELVEAYSTVGADPKGVIKVLKRHAKKHCEDHYYAIRALNHTKLSRIERAARTIYLNRTGFNGLYRVNRKGLFNVPFGDYANPTICNEENLIAVSSLLIAKLGAAAWNDDFTVGVAIRDFEIAVSDAKRGDAVYFDPPYVPVSKTANFTAYSKGGFNDEEQARLRDCFARLYKRGVHVLLSNSDTPFVRKLYKGFKLEKVQAPRRINSKGGKRGNVGELLITGRHAP